jgi:hypothetical protein
MINKISCNFIQVMNIASINFFFTLLSNEFETNITKIERIISRDRRIDRTKIKYNVEILIQNCKGICNTQHI